MHKLVMIVDNWSNQGRNQCQYQDQDQDQEIKTRQPFDGDHDHGQSRCLRNFQQIFKLSVIKY